jgi:hypothetical protein
LQRSTAHEIISDLNLLKMSALWVPKMLREEHKGKRMAALLKNVCHYQNEGEMLMESIITGHETWVYGCTSE